MFKRAVLGFFLAFLCCNSLTLSANEVVVSTTFDDHLGSEIKAAVFVVAERLEGEVTAESVIASRRIGRATPTGSVSLTLDDGAWSVTAYADGYWGSTAEVAVPGVTVVPLKLYRAGRVLGRALGQGIPQEVRMRFSGSPPNTESAPTGESVCTLDDGNIFSCVVPVGTFDLRLRMPGRIGVYSWDMTIGADLPTNLGNLTFEEGSAIVGFVESDSGYLDHVEGALVSLRTMDGEPILIEKTATATIPFTAPTNQRGFWQFKSVPPGEYLVTASREGLEDDSSIVHVVPNAEVTITRPLILSQPWSWELFVNPPTEPNGEQWSVILFRENDDRTKDPIVSDVSPDGYLTMNLRSGRYRLILGSEKIGNVYTKEFEFGPDSEPQLQVSLDFIPVRGMLRLGNLPLNKGVVSFGGTRGAVAVHMTANAQGRFEGYLPNDGGWLVEINAVTPKLKTFLNDVSVTRNSSGVAVVNINIPNTSLHGVARDENGRPVANARVTIFREGGDSRPVSMLTNGDGKFESGGFEEARYILAAEGKSPTLGRMESDPVTIDLSETSSDNEIGLTLYGSSNLTGIVTSALGPIPNARVLVVPANGVGRVAQGVSNVNGEFELPIRRSSRQLTMIVSSPGFALRLLEHRLDSGSSGSLDIQLLRSAGTLVIHGSQAVDSAAPLGNVVLFRGATWAPLSLLRRWAATNGGGVADNTMVVPRMEPGPYRLCAISGSVVEPAAVDDCDEGVLLPDGELILKADW